MRTFATDPEAAKKFIDKNEASALKDRLLPSQRSECKVLETLTYMEMSECH